jgi:hypothetical protein
VGTKGLCLVGPSRSGEKSRPDSRDSVAAGSSVGRLVARKARRSRGQELVQGSGSQSESAREVCGGSPQNWPGYLVEPQNQDRRLDGRRQIRARREASKQRTRVGSARLASSLSKVRCRASVRWCYDENSQSALEGVYPYILRGERMSAISWNPNSFGFPIFPSYFP